MKVGLASIAIVVLLVLAWLATRTYSTDPAAFEVPLAAVDEADPKAEEPRASSDRSAIAASTLDAPPAPDERALTTTRAVLRGRVSLREDGSGVAGVEVKVRVLFPKAHEDRATRTDDEGRYRLEVSAPGDVNSVEVPATAETTGLFQWKSLRLRPDAEVVIDLTVSRGATLSGRVIDTEGSPIANTTVEAWCRATIDFARPPDRTATTTADGRFSVAHLGEAFFLVARAPGLVCYTGLRGELVPGRPVEGLDVVIGPPTTIRGRVVDARDERPVDGARLVVDPTGTSSSELSTTVSGVVRFYAYRVETKSAADGSFALGPLPAREYGLRVEHPDYVTQDAHAQLEANDLVVRLDAGNEVRGRVFGSDGRAIAGAKVRVHGGFGNRKTTMTDAQGRFVARALQATSNGLVLVAIPGHAICAEQPIEIGPSQGEERVVQLSPPKSLAGSVVDEDDRPVADAPIEIEGDRVLDYGALFGTRTTWEWAAGKNRTRTDARGEFRFDDLYEGEFTIRAAFPDDAHQNASVVVRSGSSDLVLRLDRRAMDKVVLAGRVVDGRSGAPVSEFTVIAITQTADGGAGGGNEAIRDLEGRFRLAGYEPGHVQLVVQAAGYARWVEDRDLEVGEHEFDVRLLPTSSVRLSIVDSAGDRVAFPVGVRYRTLDGRSLPIEMGSSWSLSAMIGNGQLITSGLPADLIEVVVDPREIDPITSRVDLRSADIVEHEVVVRFPPNRMHTFVFTRLAEPAANVGAPLDVTVFLRFRNAKVRNIVYASIVPDGSGEYRWEWERLYGGSSGGGSSRSAELSLPLPGHVVDVDVRAEGHDTQIVDLRGGPGDRPVNIGLVRSK